MLYINEVGAANTIESDPWISVIVTDIPDGKVTRKELFLGRDTDSEPLRRTLTFVRVLNPWNVWPSINTSNPPAARIELDLVRQGKPRRRKL